MGNKKMKNNYKQAFSFLFILNMLDISVPENAEPIINYSFGVFILSLLVLFSLLNAFISLFSLYILSKYDVNEKFSKYPRVIKLIKYYEGSSLLFIFIEFIIIIIFTLVLIFSSLAMLGIHVFYS
jgi:hypothetical protein